MKARQPRDGGALTLLVQLFGREILDRLARAGFNDVAAISLAGPERLAIESGISASQAQRIVAVLAEMLSPSLAPVASTEAGSADPAVNPRRRKNHPRRSAVKAPAKTSEAPPRPGGEDLVDPFVDDAALVAWMGFSSITPSGRTAFSVADGILDPVRRESAAQEDARRIAPGPAPAPPSISAAAVMVTQARKDEAPESGEEAAPRRAHLLPGSFWTFGRTATPNAAPDEAIARPSGRTPDSEEPAGAPPRRDRHDH